MSNHQNEIFEEHQEESLDYMNDQDSDNEFERRSGEDLQELTQIHNLSFDISYLQGQLQANLEIESELLEKQILLQTELKMKKDAMKELQGQQDAEAMGHPLDK